MAYFKAMYKKPYVSLFSWLESRDVALLRTNIVRDTTKVMKLIKKRIKDAQSQEKSCVNGNKKRVQFSISDLENLKISPIKKANTICL